MVDPQASQSSKDLGQDLKKNGSGTGISIQEQEAPLKSLFLTKELKQWQWVHTVLSEGTYITIQNNTLETIPYFSKWLSKHIRDILFAHYMFGSVADIREQCLFALGTPR